MTEQHSRNPSALSSSPSIASGSSPVNSDTAGLSRRLSWNKGTEDDQPRMSTSPSYSNAYYTRRSNSLDFENPFKEDHARNPYSFQQPSQTSLADFQETTSGVADDEQHLTGAARPPWRGDDAYDDDTERLAADPIKRRRERYVGSSPLRSASASVGGSALRAMSRSIRRVSIRVVDLASTGTKDQAVRLEDLPDDDPDPRGAEETLPNLTGTRLRGSTLGIFGADSRIRRAMFNFLQWPWTEPMILVLIFIHAIVLIIQSSHSIFDGNEDSDTNSDFVPRPPYFSQWEDFVLFVLFVLYSLESFARIIVSGLFVDPDVKWTSVRISLKDLLSQKRPLNRDAMDRRGGMTKSSPSARVSDRPSPSHAASLSTTSVWRVATAEESRPHLTRGTSTLEAPFQSAIEKQRSLSEQGRPYLRHSWHRIDFVSVVSFWITFALSIAGVESTAHAHIYIFRALSVMRISRLLAVTSGTATIMRSLKKAAPLLVRVATFILFAMVLFSVIGVQAFKGSFSRTCQLVLQDGSVVDQGQGCGGFVNSSTLAIEGYIDSSGQSVKYTKGYVCAIGQTCVDTGDNPMSGLESFDNIIFAALQVTIIASVNTWAPVMYQMMDTEFFISCLFFVFGVIIINFWLLNMFVAVITNTFSAIREETKKSAFGATVAGPTFDEQDEGWSVIDGKHVRAMGMVLKWYNYTTWVWVLLALVSLGFQASRSATSSPDHIQLMNDVELYITIAFDFEIVWRMVGHLPDWRSFYRHKHNLLDLLLAVVSTIIQLPAISNSQVYPWLTIFQLTRFYRVILFVPRMRPLLLQVFGNLYGLVNMTLFLLLTNLIGGLIAIQLFRGDIPDDKGMSFKQTFNAFLAMYQIFSSENWTDVLYNAGESEIPFKQAAIGLLFLSVWFLFANFIMLQMFIAVINENFEVAEEQKRAQQVQAYVRDASPSSTQVSWLDKWNPYRFIRANPKAIAVDALPPNLMYPIQKSLVQDQRGIRLGHMTSPSVDQLINGDAPHRRGFAGTLERLFELNPRHENIPLANLKHGRRESGTGHELLPDEETEKHLDILNAAGGEHTNEEANDDWAEAQARKADFINSHPTYDRTLWLFSQKNPFRKLLQKMVAPSNGVRINGTQPSFLGQAGFQLFILLAILGGISVAAVATPVYRRQYVIDHPDNRFPWFEIAEATFGLVLVVEFIIKVIADGFVFTPNAYVYNIWNLVDFFILMALLGNLITTLAVVGSVSRFARSLKAFRAIRLITMFGWMRSTFHSVIFAGAVRILDAAVLAILYMIPYAVWGLNIFNGLMFSCNDGSMTGKADCINEYTANPIDDVNLGFLAPRAWDNPRTGTQWSFDNFRSSLLILFETVSLEGWIDVLQAAMAITSRDEQPSQDASQVNAIFFLAYNLLGAVVILTLFVSIIIGNFSSRSGMALLTSEQRQWIDLQKLLKRQRPSRRPKVRPAAAWRQWCFDRAVHKHGWWSRGMTFVYCLHIVNLITQTFYPQTGQFSIFDIFFLVLTAVYFIDVGVRFFGLGGSFWLNGWNIFDVIVVLGTFSTTMAIVLGSEGFAIQQLQKLFLVSIAFKLVQKFNGLNQLFKTSVASLPAILKLFLLWLVLFLFFGIADVEVFGLTRWNSGETYNQNYRSLGRALVMLAFMSTGEGWNEYMHDYATKYPFCTNATENEPYSDCGSPGWAFTMFIAWNVLSMYIFVNMFTGVVVENFSYVFQLSGPVSVTREEMRAFKKVWAEFDPARRGYIKRGSFVKFFSRLSGVFEVRIHPVDASVPALLAAAQDPDIDDSTDDGKKPSLRNVNVHRLNQALNKIDYELIRKRRSLYNRLYHEALVVEEPGKGISFTNMLLLLAHYKIIDDEKALKVDEMLRRQVTTDYVTDRVNLDRVRSLLKMIYHRRQHVAWKEEQMMNRRSDRDIPAILVDGRPSTPPPSTRDITLAGRESIYLTETPSRPYQSQPPWRGDSPSSPSRPSRRTSDLSMLSADLGSRSGRSSRESSPTRDSRVPRDPQQLLQSLNSSVWGEMMQDVDED